ncbi:MAG: hypothetical protein NVSMB64_07070 [Candidatus Velthaea sp.]
MQKYRECRLQLEIIFPNDGREGVDELLFRIVVHEEFEQLRREQLRGGRLLEDDGDDVLAVEISGSSEEGLRPIIVLCGIDDEAAAPASR